jgi:hypothetical protein
LKQEDFPALLPEITTVPPAHLVQRTPTLQREFPALTVKPSNIMDVPAVESKAGNAWDTKQKLFADAPAAIAPPVELFQSMNIEVKEEEDPMNPNSKSFNAKKYYVDLIGNFRCPHTGCG